MKVDFIRKYVTKKSITISVAIIAMCLLCGAVFYVAKYRKEQEQNRKLEARFDKFMGYHYPYLEQIARAFNIYSRQQISLMYDYLKNHKGRYINENVSYYDNGEFFSMRENCDLMTFFENARLLHVARSTGPIYCAPSSRFSEYKAFHDILDASQGLSIRGINIFDDNIALYNKADIVRDKIDSLNLCIQSSIYALRKYKNREKEIDLNSIPESDFDLDNY